MESYYDSDDDVCWGPYTKREFLRDVLQPRNKEDIASRHSISCDPRFSNDIDKRGESLIELETEPLLQSGYCAEPNQFIEKISEILNNTQEEVLNCSGCSEHYDKLEISETDEIADEENEKMKSSKKDILDDSDVYFSAKSIISNARHENTSFITCSFESRINDDVLNINSGSDNLCLDRLTMSDAEATSANSSYKKDDDPVDYNNQMKEVQVISESEEGDASFEFNDTLEEIERLLNAEVDINEISKFSSEAELESVSSNKLNPPPISLIPVPSRTKTNYETLAHSIPSQSPCRAEFKIPERPVRPKLVSPMHANSKDRFKNIKSPVAVYIKNAPVTPLHVKVTPKKCKKELICENTKSSEKQNKENVVEFPQVIYRQPKHTVTNTQSTFKLPKNIESLLPGQNLVTKHVAKFGGKKNSISRRLLEEDLTLNITSDDSSLNSTSQNMSIYESKRTFI